MWNCTESGAHYNGTGDGVVPSEACVSSEHWSCVSSEHWSKGGCGRDTLVHFVFEICIF